MTSFVQSLRILRKHWKLTLIAWLSLTIAMALGVVSLSLSNTFLLLRPAAPEADRLVNIHSRSKASAVEQISYPAFQYFREKNQVFTDIAAAPNSLTALMDENFAKRQIRLAARPVSDNYFVVLGIRPFLGRLFQPGDDSGDAKIAVMTWTCWRRLGSDPQIIGKTIAGVMIVGVTPREFTGTFYGLNGDLLLPLNNLDSSPWRTRRDERRLFLLARLRPGVTKQQARMEMAGLAAQLARAFPEEDQDRTAVVTRATLLPPDGLEGAELGAAILMSLVLLVLLIACANVASLLLAVAVGRRQEASIKLALGASRRRLTREFLRESAILCSAAGGSGYWVSSLVISRLSELSFEFPIYGAFSVGLHLRLDLTVTAFAVGLVLVAILATGLAPALYASSPHISQALSGEIAVGGTRKTFRRSVLVAVQVATCTLVLVGVGLCQRSLDNLRHTDPGFRERNIAVAEVFLRGMGYTEDRGRQVYQDLRTRLQTLPGVKSVTLASDLPLFGGNSDVVSQPGKSSKVTVQSAVVDADFFATVGIPLQAGRAFGREDTAKHPNTAIVNRKMAGILWPGEDPLGKVFLMGQPLRSVSVVGLVPDGKYGDLYQEPGPVLYLPMDQHYQDGAKVVIRTAGDPAHWLQPLARAIRGMGIPLALEPYTFDHLLNLTLLSERLLVAAVAALSGLSLFLAVIGLFGAVSYSVSERRKELGIRVALGAETWQLRNMVLRQTGRIGATGVAIGIVPGVGITMLVRSMLYRIQPVEPGVLLRAGGAMLAISVMVAWLSARPWLRVDPMEAVRHS